MTPAKSPASEVYDRALRLLARRSHSRLELQRKLVRRAPPGVVEDVLEVLENKGLLNDEAFAFQRALSCRLHRFWGARRIDRDLKRLGIDARIVGRILDRVNGEKSERESLDEVLRRWSEKKRIPRKIAQLKKAYDHCIRLGYAPALIREALEPYFERVQWKQHRHDDLE